MVLKEYIFTSRPDANVGGGYGTSKTVKNVDRTGDGFPYSLRDYDLDELPEVWDDEEELDRFSTKVRNAYVAHDKMGSFVGDRSAFVKGSTRGLAGRAIESIIGGRSHTGTATNPDIYKTKPGRAIGTKHGWSSAPYPHMDDDDEPIFNLKGLARKRWNSHQPLAKRARVEPPADGAYTQSDDDDETIDDQEMLLRSVIRSLV